MLMWKSRDVEAKINGYAQPLLNAEVRAAFCCDPHFLYRNHRLAACAC
jgi:hypothetical protein